MASVTFSEKPFNGFSARGATIEADFKRYEWVTEMRSTGREPLQPLRIGNGNAHDRTPPATREVSGSCDRGAGNVPWRPTIRARPERASESRRQTIRGRRSE